MKALIVLFAIVVLVPAQCLAVEFCMNLTVKQTQQLANAKNVVEAQFNRTYTNEEFVKQLIRRSMRWVTELDERKNAQTIAGDTINTALDTFDQDFPNDFKPTTTTTTSTLPGQTTTTTMLVP